MSTIPVSQVGEAASALLDRWLEYWQRENDPAPFTGHEPAAAAAPPTQEAGTSPMPVSPAAAAPLPRRSPESHDSGLLVLQALTEQIVALGDPFGAPAMAEAPCAPAAPLPGVDRQAGGAILRFPGRRLPTPRPSMTAPHAVRPTAVPAPQRLAALEEAPSQMPVLIEFSPRTGLRPLLTAGLTLSATLTGLWVLVAVLLPTSTTLGAAAVLAVVTGLLWMARSRSAATVVTIEDGVLKIVRGESRHEFPLEGVHPPIDILGSPGDRAWKVLIQRRGMRPYIVDSSMVEPYEFTDAIRRFRPRA
jgi:hypothetical protein